MTRWVRLGKKIHLQVGDAHHALCGKRTIRGYWRSYNDLGETHFGDHPPIHECCKTCVKILEKLYEKYSPNRIIGR